MLYVVAMSLHRWIKPDHSITGTEHEQICSACGVRRYRVKRMIFWGSSPLYCWQMKKIACEQKVLQAIK